MLVTLNCSVRVVVACELCKHTFIVCCCLSHNKDYLRCARCGQSSATIIQNRHRFIPYTYTVRVQCAVCEHTQHVCIYRNRSTAHPCDYIARQTRVRVMFFFVRCVPPSIELVSGTCLINTCDSHNKSVFGIDALVNTTCNLQ